MKYLDNFLFCQPNADARRELFMRSLLAILSLLLIWGPYHPITLDFYNILYPNALETSSNPFLIFLKDKSYYSFLQLLTFISVVSCFYKRGRKVSLVGATLLFITFQYVNYLLTPSTWLYNTHLIHFLVILALTELFQKTKYEKDMVSFSLAYPILYIGLIYFQSGMGKMLTGGLQWITTGAVLKQFPVLIESTFGEFISTTHLLPEFLSLATIVIQFSIIFLIFKPKIYPLLGLFLIVFHILIALTVKVLFWYLILLYPALFIFKIFTFKSNKNSSA
jgi:hypothetical protein